LTPRSPPKWIFFPPFFDKFEISKIWNFFSQILGKAVKCTVEKHKFQNITQFFVEKTTKLVKEKKTMISTQSFGDKFFGTKQW
jgi:hypothetical protein